MGVDLWAKPDPSPIPRAQPPAWYVSLLGIPAATQRNSICHRAGSRLLRRPHVLRREELQGGPQAGFLLTKNRSGSQSIQQKFSWSTVGSVASENPSSGLSTRHLEEPRSTQKVCKLARQEPLLEIARPKPRAGPALSGSQLKGICSSCLKLFYHV